MNGGEDTKNKFVTKAPASKNNALNRVNGTFPLRLSHLPKFRNQALTKLDKVISDALHLDPFNLNWT